jgi:hypothetical protein
MIQPAYVTFEQAKWLKGKGFKNLTNCYYFEDGEFRQYKIQDTYGYYGEKYTVELEELYNNWNDNFLQKKNGDRCFGCSKQNGYLETFSAPEQHQVIEWLRVNHGIWVEVGFYYNPEKLDKKFFEFGTANINTGEEGLLNNAIKRIGSDWTSSPKEYNLFNTPQEAYSAAFDYIKDNNLI